MNYQVKEMVSDLSNYDCMRFIFAIDKKTDDNHLTNTDPQTRNDVKMCRLTSKT